MTQPLGRVSRQMIDVIEGMAIKEAVNQPVIQYGSLNKRGFVWDIIAESPTQVVQDHYIVAQPK
jgi:hypothetical protein